ncbi:hypothetical protein QFZ40_000295 [Arthrobacter pascens]|uniref:hypothetical protein n=1 Tax=Arthrobacter pascens TaxID=1677 RepID=UPI002786F2ED|nr:hypothetical protein [Arthrobacter pascens]MDQ0632386.1 hypothetical protein [Arthrobacter pascens]
MSDEVLFGLFAIGISILGYVLIRLVRGVVVKGYSRTFPDRDAGRFRRFQEIGGVVFPGLIFLIGVGFLIFGLMGGKVGRG